MLLEKIYQLRKKDPSIKAIEISRIIGCSRERVRQILLELNLPTHFPKHKYYCIDCGKVVQKKAKRCRNCWLISCRNLLICEVCKKKFYRKKSDIRAAKIKNYQHIFCSKCCQGFWLGTNYGRFHNKWNSITTNDILDILCQLSLPICPHCEGDISSSYYTSNKSIEEYLKRKRENKNNVFIDNNTIRNKRDYNELE